MGLIVFLLLLGAFFLVAEIVFLPGVTVGAVLSLASYGAAAYFGFVRFGMTGLLAAVAAAAVLSGVVAVVSLRAKTWRRLSLGQKIESSSMDTPSDTVKIGQRGTAVSRLSPMGKVNIDGKVYEAKSADGYVDQRSAVEVVGFENFTVVVRRAEHV